MHRHPPPAFLACLLHIILRASQDDTLLRGITSWEVVPGVSAVRDRTKRLFDHGQPNRDATVL